MCAKIHRDELPSLYNTLTATAEEVVQLYGGLHLSLS